MRLKSFIQNMKEVFEMRAANDLLIKEESLIGVRTYVGKHSDSSVHMDLLPPPHFGEHTEEVMRYLDI